jgi:hypothetical protein
VSIESPDLTTVVIRLSKRLIFMVLVYVEGGDTAVLLEICDRLCKAIIEVRRYIGILLEIIIIGDFNRYNQL